ncbi:uncharacterized protein I206_105828 [Kwoniella pini CBS 10737]|uniref:Uncharacterized protein n=1 Tax=Kwoniella pini CBS 10737 TaxID=1296096 RepID=A0A1B9I0H9_9TREE|nr:uncharacterized protein I206_04648 [Kwoniella pini CBS 10737]OCF48961.1 hypothetical protein I206_04648 [Kwoniella pini CBS 10737]
MSSQSTGEVNSTIEQSKRFQAGRTDYTGTWTLRKLPWAPADLGVPGFPHTAHSIRYKILSFNGTTTHYDDREKYKKKISPNKLIDKNFAILCESGVIDDQTIISDKNDYDVRQVWNRWLTNDISFQNGIKSYTSDDYVEQQFEIEGTLTRTIVNTKPITCEIKSGTVTLRYELKNMNQEEGKNNKQNDITIGSIEILKTANNDTSLKQIETFLTREFANQTWTIENESDLEIKRQKFYRVFRHYDLLDSFTNHLHRFWVNQRVKKSAVPGLSTTFRDGTVHWKVLI